MLLHTPSVGTDLNSHLSCRDFECCGDLAPSSAVKGRDSTSSNSDAQDSGPDLVDSLETEWTNEKHSSYLNSIEASFVKKMYDSEYCALDLCGRAPKEMKTVDPDSAESRLNFPSPFNEFKVWQNGHWQTPTAFNSQEFMLPTVVGSTWIQQFRKPTSTIDESWRNSPDKGLLHKSKTIENVPCAGQGTYAWHNRLHNNYSGSASIYDKRMPSTAHDGNFVSVEDTDCNFKDEDTSHQKFEDHANIRKAEVGVDDGCRSCEDQVVPFIGSANTNEAGGFNYPSKVQGFSGYALQHCNGSINFPSWKKRGGHL